MKVMTWKSRNLNDCESFGAILFRSLLVLVDVILNKKITICNDSDFYNG